MEGANRHQVAGRASNRTVVLACLGALVAMGGLTYASVPLYRLFCQVTGVGGTTQRADSKSATTIDRAMTIRFDANTAPGLPWTFEPVQSKVEVKIGENVLAFFRATNTSDRPVTGAASFNVSPEPAGPHFKKIECFCFKEQTLAPGESVEMPVTFFVDPAIDSDRDARRINEITLSYTFYAVPTAEAGRQAGSRQGS